VLSMLVPGFRQVRAPLAAGSLLLVTSYLALDIIWRVSNLAPPRPGPGARSIIDFVGPGGIAIALGVGAYLLGSLYMALARRVQKTISAGRIQEIATSAYLFEQGRGRLFFLSPFSRPSLRRLGTESGAFDAGILRRRAWGIVFSDGIPLLSSHESLYHEYDRLMNEAEFRDAVALQLPIVAGLLSSDAGLSAGLIGFATIFFAVLGFWLFVQSRTHIRKANSIFAHACADGKLPAPESD
jgi:hypothetical protein